MNRETKIAAKGEKYNKRFIGLIFVICKPLNYIISPNIVIRTGLVVLQYPQGILFGDEKAFLVIGIAARGDEHMDILSALATALDNPDLLEELYTTTDKQRIFSVLGSAINDNNNY